MHDLPENLGEALAGEKAHTSAFKVRPKKKHPQNPKTEVGTKKPTQTTAGELDYFLRIVPSMVTPPPPGSMRQKQLFWYFRPGR